MLAKGQHQIEIQYYDTTGTAYIQVDVNKVAIPLSTNQWNGLLFPNIDFTGTPVSESTESLNYSWGSKAPHTSISAAKLLGYFSKESDGLQRYEVHIDGKSKRRN